MAELEAHGLRERCGALERALSGVQAAAQELPAIAQLQADYQGLLARCREAEVGASVSAVQAADARVQLDEAERLAAEAREGAAQMHAALVSVEARLREAEDREAEVLQRVREASEEAQAMMAARDQLLLREEAMRAEVDDYRHHLERLQREVVRRAEQQAEIASAAAANERAAVGDELRSLTRGNAELALEAERHRRAAQSAERELSELRQRLAGRGLAAGLGGEAKADGERAAEAIVRLAEAERRAPRAPSSHTALPRGAARASTPRAPARRRRLSRRAAFSPNIPAGTGTPRSSAPRPRSSTRSAPPTSGPASARWCAAPPP